MKLVIVFLVIIAVIILFVLTNIRIVPQSKAFVIERLGAYFATWETGLHVKVPFIDRIAKTVSLKEQVVDFKPQPVITKDNVTMQIDTVVFFQITDPKLYCYGVENPIIPFPTAPRSRVHLSPIYIEETLSFVLVFLLVSSDVSLFLAVLSFISLSTFFFVFAVF